MTKSFKDLESLIFKEKTIILDNDIALNMSERFNGRFKKGIKINIDNVVIDGKGHSINAKESGRIFNITGKNIIIKNLTFKNGDAKYGGAIRNEYGQCEIINCKFTNNVAKKEGNNISNGPNSIMKIIDCEFVDNDNNSILNKGYITSNQKNEIDSICSSHSDGEIRDYDNTIHTKLVIVDNDTDKLIGENHVLTIKLSDSEGNGISGQLINIGDLGIAITGVDGQAVFTWKSDVIGDKFFSIYYKGKINSNENYDYDAAKPIEGKFTTKTEHGMDLITKESDKYDPEEIKHEKHYKMVNDKDELSRSCQELTPFKAYHGDEPYIFVSYALIDSELVYPEIERFHNDGYKIWYDEGKTRVGYAEVIESKLINCSLFVVFISNNSIESFNIRNEINYAIYKDIPTIPIFLEEVELKYGLGIPLATTQSILKYALTEEQYEKKYQKLLKQGLENSSDKNVKIESISQNETKNDTYPSLEEDNINIESEYSSENDSDITLHAYQGDDDYVFISYAHLDSEPVLSELKYFEEFGINIWYDEGITPSTEWPEVIQEKLEKSLLLIIFITPNSIESQNVRNEINYASSINKPFIPIHLKNTKLKYGMGIQLGSVQAILKYELDAESYVEKCIKSFKLNGLDIKNIPSTISLKYQKYDENEEDEKEIIELKQTFNNEENMLNLHWNLNQIFLEMKHSNNLKEFELGVIDEKEFNQRRNKYNNLLKKLYEKRNN